MATETHAADAAQGASAPGMPQLDFSNWGNQIFWLMITLVVIQLLLLSFALLSLRESALTSWVFAVRSIAPTPAPIKAEE